MRVKFSSILLILTVLLLGCKDKVVEPATESATNKWIYEQMNYWYYWNAEIPKTPDYSKSPKDFFSSLLYKYDATLRPNGDRFSWIQESATELEESLSGKTTTTGMEFKLSYYPAGSKSVIGLATYILPNSPAQKAGFKRGDFFMAINGESLTADNYSKLIATEGTLSYTLGEINQEGIIVATSNSRSVGQEVIQANPVYFDTLYVKEGKTIGYLVYNQFYPEPYQSGTGEYDKKLETIIGNFKSKGATALILDLRYNPGGYVSSATQLASLIGKVTTNDIFYYKEYNSNVTPDLTKKYGESFFYDKFKSKAQNIGSQLDNLIVLTSTGTASASELLINGLKPFMKVSVIGGKTVGKNVGSITLTNEEGGIKYGLQPIVTKSFNSLHQSDYSTGFVPEVSVTEGLKLYPFGSPEDPLLGEALFKITGIRTTRVAAKSTLSFDTSDEIMSSISKKAGGSNMFFDK